ncbi:MAG: hypothetical protein LBK71_08190 [Verrucomicrobiales bacterium]|jgi:uroporphyrinogen decarboxylase|nr:hypothetical protein [Verrucomicrobiales bacterium]
MNNRERSLAILNYENYDRLPVVHFGYWRETLEKWAAEGHITQEMAAGHGDGNDVDVALDELLGFDYCWGGHVGARNGLFPGFPVKVIERRADGMVVTQGANGLIEATKEGVVSIPQTIGTLMTGRAAWEELYKPRLQPSLERCTMYLESNKHILAKRFDYRPHGIFAGSLIGSIRDMLGVEGLSYLYADDEELYAEIIATNAEICFQNVKNMLEGGLRVDYLHFWEDICFNNGPLITPEAFAQYVAPQYKRITDLAATHGVKFTSVDCDGCIDKLVPLWLHNGANIMFPIEVGTWAASIAPWRAQYGRDLRGVGGMNKNVLGRDRAAIDAEIERLKPLVALGGYIPCPDHRIPPEATWDNTRYYCDKMRKVFG